MASKERDPYLVLGVARRASADEIARAFRRAAVSTHPDTSDAGAASAGRFRAVADAYETLRDPARRAAYDRAHPVRVDPPGPHRWDPGADDLVRLLRMFMDSGW